MPLYTKKSVAKLKYVGSDVTAGSAINTTTETVIGQVTIPSNTVKTFLIAIASLISYNATTSLVNYVFRIRCGTTGDITDTQYNTQTSEVIGILEDYEVMEMGGLQAYITGPDWTVQNYVSVTVQMDVANDKIIGNCQDLVVLGE